MKKGKNKFILCIIALIIAIIGFQWFQAFSQSNRDTQSYVSVIEGKVLLNNVELSQNSPSQIKIGDSISVGEKSMGLIEWGDGSLTRLGENTKIIIENNFVSKDVTKINISFDLISGKTWSNVVSFFGKDSSFTQSFQGLEAGVRGTIFDVDLDKDYLQVSSHQVILKDKNGKEQIIEEGNPITLSTLSLIDIQEFIKDVQDTTWKNINEQYDTLYFESLKGKLETSFFESPGILFFLDFISPKYRLIYELNTSKTYETVHDLIGQLSSNQKSKIYPIILSRYQKLNFIESKDVKYYTRKVFYKKALLELNTDMQEQEQLLRSLSFDVRDMLQTSRQVGLEDTLDFLMQYKQDLSFLPEDFFSSIGEYIPQDIGEKIQNNTIKFQELFGEISSNGIDTTSVKSKAEESLQKVIESTVGKKLLPNFSK